MSKTISMGLNQCLTKYSCSGHPKNKSRLLVGFFRFYSLFIPGNGLAKTFGNGVSNSMSSFLMGWWKQSL